MACRQLRRAALRLLVLAPYFPDDVALEFSKGCEQVIDELAAGCGRVDASAKEQKWMPSFLSLTSRSERCCTERPSLSRLRTTSASPRFNVSSASPGGRPAGLSAKGSMIFENTVGTLQP